MTKKILIILTLGVILSGCTDPKGATNALLDSGYTDIKIKGADIFACSDEDPVATSFTAKGPTGRPVRGTVCSGYLTKDQTIRLKR